MIPPIEKFNYQALHQELLKQGAIVEHVDAKKNSFDAKFWMTVCKYFEEKAKHELATEHNEEVQCKISNQLQVIEDLNNKEHALLDQKLKQIFDSTKELEKKNQEQMKSSYQMLDTLYSQFTTLPKDYEDEKIRLCITNDTAISKHLKSEIEITKKELEHLEAFVEDSNYFVAPTSNEINQILQKLTCTTGNHPVKLQKHLSEIHKSIEFLTKEIKDIQIKYDM